MRIAFILSFFIALLIPRSELFSQENNAPTIPTIIFLTDGSELIGTIVSEDSLTISFQTMSKIAMIIPRDQVKELRRLQGVIIDGTYYRYDPNVTRLFLAPTARPLAKGQGCFSAYQVFFPFLAYGVNDFLTIGGGISLLPGASEQLLYVTPKIVPYKKEDHYCPTIK